MISIYILELQNNKFYVGQTKDVNDRFLQHVKGKVGSEWTKKYKPIKIHKIINTSVNTIPEALHIENKITIDCMKEHGWENVRGGDYCSMDKEKLRFLLALHSDIGDDLMPFKNGQNYPLNFTGKCFFVLKLENNNYFVGLTDKLMLAILSENNGMGSEWTKINKPVELINVIKINEEDNKVIREKHNTLVIHYMKVFGFKNVRGGDFFKIDERNHKNKVLNYTDIFRTI